MKLLYAYLFCAIIFTSTNAQILDLERLEQSFSGGKTRTVLIDNNDSNLIYTAGINGGLWYSTDAGNSWEEYAYNIDLPTMSIGKIVQANNGTIYFSTGEPHHGIQSGNFAFTFSDGFGIYKIDNIYAYFEQIDSTQPTVNNNVFADINDFAIDPLNDLRIFVATDNTGIIKTEDGGTTWIVPNSAAGSILNNGVCHDVKFNADGSKVFVTIENKIYRSIDGGNNFEPAYTGILEGGSRKEIAVSPTNPDAIYILINQSGGEILRVVQSLDGGDNFIEIGTYDPINFNPMGSSGFYSSSIVVDPSNDERIFLGGESLWTWETNVGWQQIDTDSSNNNNFIPIYKHDLIIDENNPNTLYVASDAGIYKSENAQIVAPTFSAKNENLQITQAVNIASSFNGKVLASTSSFSPNFIHDFYDPTNNNESTVINNFNDIDMSFINPELVFFYFNGEFTRSFDGGMTWDSWIPSAALVQFNSGSLYNPNFHFYEDLQAFQNEDTIISRYFIGNNNVGLTIDAHQYSTSANIIYLGSFASSVSQGGALSCTSTSKNGDCAWFGSTRGRLMRTRGLNDINNYDTIAVSGQVNFDFANYTTNFSNNPWQTRMVTGVHVNQYNKTEVVVSIDGTNAADNVYLITDAQSNNPTFTSIHSNLPSMLVYDIVFEETTNNYIIAATEYGIWVYDRSTNVWTENNGNMGRTRVVEIEQKPIKELNCPILYFATMGRGVWRSTNFAENFGCDVSIINSTESINQQLISSIKVAPNPIKNEANISFQLKKIEPYTLKLIDLNGRIVYTKKYNSFSSSNQNINFKRGKIQEGLYLLVIESKNKVQFSKVMLSN